MRFVAGVDEELMDKVPWERSWYASLGGIVLATATIGACSMWFAVGEAIGVISVGALPPVLAWFVFIVIFDRWVVSTRSTDAWQKIILFATRASLAVLFGIVIAEPLVLRIFQTQIEHEVRNDRAEVLRELQTNLQDCNPDPADPSTQPIPSTCKENNYILTFTAAPAAQLRQLTELQRQATSLQQTITSDSATLNTLNTKAVDECAGRPGPGLTGVWGEGINCLENRKAARQFAESHPIQDQQARLSVLQQQITDLQESTTDAQNTFAQQRSAAIQRQLDALPQVDSRIGLLERMAALDQLGSGNSTLWLGIILVRLLFITIDCAPVLMKVASGSTFYDQLVLSSLEDAKKTHAGTLASNDSQREIDHEERAQRKREHAIQMQQRLADAVDARTAVYERQGTVNGRQPRT